MPAFNSGYDSAVTGSTFAHADAFPSPWMDYATMVMPQDITSTFRLCEHVWYANPTYRMGRERVISYFMTDVDVDSVDGKLGGEDRERYLATFNETIDCIGATKNILFDRCCYGNGFASVVVPVTRFLVCRKCGRHVIAEDFTSKTGPYKYKWSKFEFTGQCGCGYTGAWDRNDQLDVREDRVVVRTWSPHEIRLVHDMVTGQNAYFWDIPNDYAEHIRAGTPHIVARTPWEVVEAVQAGVMLRMNPENFFHMRERVLSGVRNRGWGIPSTLTHFRHVYYVQLLHRHNEAIAMDYVIPFRLLSPAATGKSGTGGSGVDPLRQMPMGEFTWFMRQAIAQRRRDPAAYQVVPFPVQYQMLGGEANQLAPYQLMEQGLDTLLNGIGVPVDFYKGSMTVQSASMGLRLMEATHHELAVDANRFLRWLAKRLSQIFSWEPVTARLRKPSFTDDADKLMLMMQLATGQVISKTTALKALDVDYKTEQRLKMIEQISDAENQEQFQKEMDRASLTQQVTQPQQGGDPSQQQGGQPAAGGQPPAGGAAPGGPGDPSQILSMIPDAGVPQTPDDTLELADAMATSLLGIPEGQRRSIMTQVRQKNQAVYAAVKDRLSGIRQTASSQGQSAILQQNFGQG